jgi:carbon storage regulator CsrA
MTPWGIRMLVFDRREGQQVLIPTPLGPIWITVVEVNSGGRNAVRLGFEAPRAITILRRELAERTGEPETVDTFWGPVPIGG